MNVTIIGTGNMARGIATRALAGGHTVTLIGHEAEKADALASELPNGAQAATEGTPIAGDIVVLAVPYPAVPAILAQYGKQLAGKVLVDITNPVDWNTMSSAVAPGTSGAEEIAKIAPADAKVLKAFNTTFAGALVEGAVGGRPLDVFVAGDDADAKALLSQLITDGGLTAVDAGGLNRAQQLEALGLLHITMQFVNNSNFGTAIALVS